jgi:two-component system phosphate regulon response regulator PhoB/two-component system alkaline phosphatase synthesis response regulator PhoP
MARSTGKFPALRGGTGKQRPVTGKFPALQRTLLVIDDEPDIARLINKIFERRGYRILVATDGEEGLARSFAELPDLVLLDINLPGLDGWEVCRRIKEDARTRGIPVLLMSAGHDNLREAERALQLGASEFIIKPFVREVLIHNVERLLAKR